MTFQAKIEKVSNQKSFLYYRQYLRENLNFGHFYCKNTVDYRVKKSAPIVKCFPSVYLEKLILKTHFNIGHQKINQKSILYDSYNLRKFYFFFISGV